MGNVVTILIVFLAVVLVLVVLMQNSKGGGLSSSFAGGNQILGVRKTTDTIEKITWGLIAAIVIFCVVSSAMSKTTVSSTSEVADQVELPATTGVPEE